MPSAEFKLIDTENVDPAHTELVQQDLCLPSNTIRNQSGKWKAVLSWLEVLEDPDKWSKRFVNGHPTLKPDTEGLYQAEESIWKRVYPNFDTDGDTLKGLRGSAMDMTVLLQTYNFVHTLREVLLCVQDLQKIRKSSVTIDHFSSILTPTVLSTKLKTVDQLVDTVFNVSKPREAHQETAVTGHALDFRSVFSRIVSVEQPRFLIVDNPVSRRDVSINLQYFIEQYGTRPSGEHDISYHPNAKESMYAAMEFFRGQTGLVLNIHA